MSYQVGHLIHVQDTDPIFNSLLSAEKFAEEATAGTDLPYGIWTGIDLSELIEIIYHDRIFVHRISGTTG